MLHVVVCVQLGLGHETLSGHQVLAMRTFLAGNDTLCLFPTGAGKTEVFLVAMLARCRMSKNSSKGIVIVPLTTLEKEQADRAKAAGLGAEQFSNVKDLRAFFLDSKKDLCTC